MKGVYVLIIQITTQQKILIKSLGEFQFKEGIWLYVGSAMGVGSTSLENRLARHFRKEKKIHWHIDVFLQDPAVLQAAIWAESVQPFECKVAQSIEKSEECISGPVGFGASDCMSLCTSHLFRCREGKKAQDIINRIFANFGLEPRITYDGSISS
jgi:Uri superfamily endonuclease